MRVWIKLAYATYLEIIFRELTGFHPKHIIPYMNQLKMLRLRQTRCATLVNQLEVCLAAIAVWGLKVESRIPPWFKSYDHFLIIHRLDLQPPPRIPINLPWICFQKFLGADILLKSVGVEMVALELHRRHHQRKFLRKIQIANLIGTFYHYLRIWL